MPPRHCGRLETDAVTDPARDPQAPSDVPALICGVSRKYPWILGDFFDHKKRPPKGVPLYTIKLLD